MLKKILICLFACCVILSSCGRKSPGAESNGTAEPAPDSLRATNAPLQFVMDKFKAKSTLPFLADTTLLFKVNTFDSLGAGEVLTLDTFWVQNSVTGRDSYGLSSFYKIDSLKASGAYAKWCDSLDIGMTKFANAYALFKIEADKNTTLLVWSTLISSYEACPFSTETSIYCTVVHRGFITQSFLLARYHSAGDPPSMMMSRMNGIINTDGTLKLSSYEEQEDLDEPFAMETRSEYEFALRDGKVTGWKEQTGKEVKMPRKREKVN